MKVLASLMTKKLALEGKMDYKVKLGRSVRVRFEIYIACIKFASGFPQTYKPPNYEHPLYINGLPTFNLTF